jgi:calcineurin-like phosphoesterase
MDTVSAVLVNVYKQLGLGTDLHDPITDERIHSMGTMYVDDSDMYTWKDAITDPFELML